MALARGTLPRRALVTGASGGLGAAIAAQLARRGCEVWLCARREQELEARAAEIRARGGRAVTRVLDVSDAAAVLERLPAWDRECGGFDLVVANAGIGAGRRGTARDFAAEARVWQVNLIGASATLSALLEPMLARGRGTLAAVISLAGRRGMPGSGAYSSSKAALTTYLDALRCEVEPRGLRVVELRPGFVHTALSARNEFHMPFAWPVERAAQTCTDALLAGRRVRAFPFPMVLACGVLRALPVWAYTPLSRRLPGARATPAAARDARTEPRA